MGPALRPITSGNVRSAVLWLALPALGEQLLNSFVALVDTFLAGQISKEATAAVGFAAYVEWLATMLFALVATGTTVLVSRAIGAGEEDQANRFTNQSLSLSIIIGVVVSGLIFAMAPSFAWLQDMTGETYRITVTYLRLDSLALTFTCLTLVGAAALRGAGDTRTPMKILGLVNILNALLSVALVFGVWPMPKMGVTGIVVGTMVARVLGGLLMISVLAGGSKRVRMRWSSLPLRREPVRRILHIGVPAASDGAVMWIGQFLFLMVIARLGSGDLQIAYYAAHMIGVRLEALIYLPATAWSFAAATVIGQNLGADQPARARRAGHAAALQCGLLACGVSVMFLLLAGPLFALMHQEPLVRSVGVGPFRMLAWFQPVLALSIVYTGALRGAGDTRFPLLITFLGVTLLRLPLAWLLGVVLGWGLMGAWLAMCADFVLRAGLAAWRFARGRWIEVKV